MLGRRMQVHTAVVASHALVLLSACALQPGERTYAGFAGFANDDSGIFLVLSSHVERPGYMGSTSVSDHEYEIRVADADGASQTTLRREEDRSVARVFYQASAGYILATTSGGGQSTAWQFDVIRLDGEVETLESGNIAPPHFLPDPTGALIARISGACGHDPCEPPRLPTFRVVQYVSFYDSETLERVGELHAVEWVRSADTAPLAAVWSPEGSLVVSDGVAAFAVSPSGDPREVEPPTCAGFTTAGGIASDGRVATVAWDGTHAVVAIAPGSGPGYPDSCFGGAP